MPVGGILRMLLFRPASGGLPGNFALLWTVPGEHPAAMLIRLILGFSSIGLLAAQDIPIVGPRALGMGGTGVSICDDQTAQYYNPAMFGFFGLRDAGEVRLACDNNDLGRKRWGGGLDLSAGYTIPHRLSDVLDELRSADLRGIAQRDLSDGEDLRRLSSLARAFSDLSRNGSTITADANAGFGFRIGNWGFGVRMNAQATGYVTGTDLVNVALGLAGPALASNIVSSSAPGDGQVTLLGSEAARSIYNHLGGDPNLPIDTSSQAWQAVTRIDYSMRSSGLSGESVVQATSLFTNLAGSGGDLQDNATVISLTGFAVTEIPVSYGFAINRNWAVGATVKGLVGRVYRNDISVFSSSADEALGKTFDAYRQTFNVGIDLSLAARTEYLQAGLIVRNLNNPSFPAPTINGRQFPDIELQPQATFSEAVIPWPWLTLAADVDLNPVETTTRGNKLQRLGIGIEVNPWRVLALRAGTYQNLADSAASRVVTLGAGVNLWAVRVDAALAVSTRRVDVVSWNVPEELRASLGVMTDF